MPAILSRGRWVKADFDLHFDGILPKGPYPPCLRMADWALLAGYHRLTLSEYLLPSHCQSPWESSVYTPIRGVDTWSLGLPMKMGVIINIFMIVFFSGFYYSKHCQSYFQGHQFSPFKCSNQDATNIEMSSAETFIIRFHIKVVVSLYGICHDSVIMERTFRFTWFLQFDLENRHTWRTSETPILTWHCISVQTDKHHAITWIRADLEASPGPQSLKPMINPLIDVHLD